MKARWASIVSPSESRIVRGRFITDTFTLTLTLQSWAAGGSDADPAGDLRRQARFRGSPPLFRGRRCRRYFDVSNSVNFPPGLTVEDGFLTGVVEQAAEVHSVVVTAFDGAGEFVRLPFDLKVHETNRAPLRRESFSGTLTLTEDVLFEMDLASLYMDEDRLDSLVYRLEGEMPEFRLLEQASLHPCFLASCYRDPPRGALHRRGTHTKPPDVSP